jgi:hypothetical protein
MRNWVWVVVAVMSACKLGPSEEELRCYQACARDKDACMLSASTPEQIQACDARSSRCSVSCEAE